LAPEEYHCLPNYDLGLTDLVKRIAGSDDILSDADFDREGLRAKIRHYVPAILAFTSKRAAEEFLQHPVHYGLLPDTVEATRLLRLNANVSQTGTR
jgi:TDG/mug DNA glycosylase family protein